MSGLEGILALVGLGGAGAAAGAGAGGAAAAPAMTGLAGMGPEAAAGGLPAFSEGGGAGAGGGAGKTSGGILGKMMKNVTAKDTMDLMKIAASSRTPTSPMNFPSVGGGGRASAAPSVAQFLQFLQSRQRPSLGG